MRYWREITIPQQIKSYLIQAIMFDFKTGVMCLVIILDAIVE